MKKKLNIEELKVLSFITELKPGHAQTAKGGDGASDPGNYMVSIALGPEFCFIESVWGCDASGGGMGEGEVSEINDEYGCHMPDVIICP